MRHRHSQPPKKNRNDMTAIRTESSGDQEGAIRSFKAGCSHVIHWIVIFKNLILDLMHVYQILCSANLKKLGKKCSGSIVEEGAELANNLWYILSGGRRSRDRPGVSLPSAGPFLRFHTILLIFIQFGF